ncbi:MAG: TIGR03842 family LLM class F420-dependent oxidoreductase, partial [Acidobacteriia bacterium]|nr:TIGR03842 family LLM class F420-dependent oxidoreductase [Terriglobia bacterium]
LAELGVDQFAVYLMHDQPEATLEAYGGIIEAMEQAG